jgi:hypothetical protein
LPTCRGKCLNAIAADPAGAAKNENYFGHGMFLFMLSALNLLILI